MRISDWSSDVCSSDLRESQSFLAPAIQHCQPVNLRQTKIQDNRVIALRRAKKMPLFAIGGEVDGVAYPFQSVFQLLAQMGLVLNNQQPHTGPSPCLAQLAQNKQIEKPSCRERVCKYVLTSGGA